MKGCEQFEGFRCFKGVEAEKDFSLFIYSVLSNGGSHFYLYYSDRRIYEIPCFNILILLNSTWGGLLPTAVESHVR